MKRYFRFFTILLAALFVVGCNSNDDGSVSNATDPFTQNFGAAVSRDFMGQVVNQSNQPLKGVTVKIGTKTVQTDFNGFFIINSANVYEQFAYITATKSGYMNGSRAMVPTSGKNNVKIMMISNTQVHVESIPSGAASEVILSNGTKINFDGAFQDESGNAYSGDVRVSMYHLEASNENLSSLMPGMLYAKDSNGEEKVLETYGMMNVELKGEAGQKLQIANGHTAQITMAIDDAQLATAPSSIPLWHFDEVKGYWIEEGSATRVGNNYIGNVSHFSWWNCDAKFPTVSLTVNIVDSNGNPLSNLSAKITRLDNNGAVGETDNNGQVSGMVPSNEPLTLTIFNDFCTFYTSTIGPFSSDTMLPTIVLSNSESLSTTQVIGDLKKCDNSNVTNGYVVFQRSNGNKTFSSVINGAFSLNTMYCNSDAAFTLKGVDYGNSTETSWGSYNLASPVTNIGTITTCNVISEYISYQIDGGETVFAYENLYGGSIPFTGGGSGNELRVGGIDSNGASISISGDISTPGIYTTATYNYNIFGPFGYIGANSTTQTNTMSFNLTNHGNFGEYIDMTFSGTYTNQTGTHTLNGVVHVIRNR